MRTLDLFDLRGKVAIVTGGAAGIGRQMAEGLAELGADLVLGARKAERCAEVAAELAASAGVAVVGVGCDVADPEQVEAMVATAVDRFDRVDVLVNNAGTTWAAPAEATRLEDWRKVLDVNLTGAFLCCQAAGRVMIGQGGGKIVNIASVAGFGGSPPELMDTVAYNASKGGLITLTRDLAVKWARHGINVNGIAPGWFPSRMSGWTLEHHGDTLSQLIPLRRFGGPHDLKGAVGYLASAASDYMTGHVLVVDGGTSAY
ncbi:MAG TPA: SDR family oxidoreductase [Actinomycetes bacterium]|nr:SDR family oxidoreductase [Actinomycetes bacterium]